MYDAEGQRILKAKGDITTTGVNGVNTTSATLDPYTIYPSGHLTISPSGRYTKHYYSGSERIVSRLAGVNDIFVSQEDLSAKVAIQENGELALFEIDLGVDNLTANTYVPDPPGDPCAQQYDPITEQEAYKQCLCEYDPANCPDNVLYYFHSDQLGSSSVLTDADGEPYQFLVYLPWGEVLGEQKAAQFSTPYQFNGKELDSETGLYNYGARYYDPSLSVWLGVDPLADAPLNIGTSPYTYVWNNPLKFIDPDGRHGQSTHLDEDGNVIAEYDDGDSGVYQHANGTTEADISSHNYYANGNTGTNVTDGGGTQIAGMEVSVSATPLDKGTVVRDEGVRVSLIVGLGVTFKGGWANDSKGNGSPYFDLGVGWGLDLGATYEWTAHKNQELSDFSIYDLNGANKMNTVGASFYEYGWGGNQSRMDLEGNYRNDYTSRSSGIGLGTPTLSQTTSWSWITKKKPNKVILP